MGNCRGLVLPVPAKALPVWAKAFVFKAGGDLTLCDLLTLAAWRQRKGEPQRFGQGIGYHMKRGRPAGHHRPFLSYSIRDVATDQAAQARLGFSRKGRGSNQHAAQCASLAIDS